MKVLNTARAALKLAKEEAGAAKVATEQPAATGWVARAAPKTASAELVRAARAEAQTAVAQYTSALDTDAFTRLDDARARAMQAASGLREALEAMPLETQQHVQDLRALMDEAGTLASNLEFSLRRPARLVPGVETATEFAGTRFETPEALAQALINRANSTGRSSTWSFNTPLIAKPGEDVAAVMRRKTETRALLAEARPFWAVQQRAFERSKLVPPPAPRTLDQLLTVLRDSPDKSDLVYAAVANVTSTDEALLFLQWAKKNLGELQYAQNADPLGTLTSNLLQIADKRGVSRLWPRELIAKGLS